MQTHQNTISSKASGFVTGILIWLVRLYRYCLSPWVGTCCRFYPSCSSYAVDALREQGTVRGIGLIGRRLLRCHPWHEGGYDPVPKTKVVKV